MTHIRSRSRSRVGFTLIELLVVIAIIATLLGLLLAGVMKALWKIPEVQTRTDISQMDAALAAFMSDYGLSDPPPSMLVLHEDMKYGATALEVQSLQFLKRTFGKNLGSAGIIDWNGDGKPNGPWILEGEQCLVFYLSGIPTAPGNTFGGLGFSTNNVNPSQPNGKRNGPYFNFLSSRLVPFTNKAKTPWFVYLDAWQVEDYPNPPVPPAYAFRFAKPYAYFSSNGINNTGYTLNKGLDCQSIGAAAYNDGVSTFTSSNRYQIISAGKDGVFGTGAWNASNGATDTFGKDDQASFSSKLLGAEQQ